MNNSRLTTKEKILDLLKKRTSMTVNQLAQELEITEMAVRKHLNALDRDAFLKISEEKQPMGRPVQFFSLSSKADSLFPKNYDNLTVDFLNDLHDMQGDQLINQLFENRGKRLANKYIPYMEQAQTNTEKIQILRDIQAEKGYMADVIQVTQNKFELIEHHCPIFEVAKNFKQACHCESAMFKDVLGTSRVERTQCKADGENHCHFMIVFEEEKIKSK